MYQVICLFRCVDTETGLGFWNKANLVKLMTTVMWVLNYYLNISNFDVLSFNPIIADTTDID